MSAKVLPPRAAFFYWCNARTEHAAHVLRVSIDAATPAGRDRCLLKVAEVIADEMALEGDDRATAVFAGFEHGRYVVRARRRSLPSAMRRKMERTVQRAVVA